MEVLFLILLLGPLGLGRATDNLHQPFNLTWMVTDVSTGDILNQTSKVAPLNIWYPELSFDLWLLFLDWHTRGLLHNYFYVCPSSKQKGGMCWRTADFFGRSWGYESMDDIY